MNELQIFNYSEGQVRTVLKDGQLYFVAKDICEILGLNTSESVNGRGRSETEGLDDDEKDIDIVDTLGGKQEMIVVTESGLYSLVMKSRKLEAKAFKRWITHDVIPSIRKHGMYAKDELLDNPELLLDVITRLKAERDKNKFLETENKLLAQDAVKWADRKVIDALVKVYGAKIGFQEAWREFKKELLYAHSINLTSRLTNKVNETGRKNFKVLDMIHDDEIPACVRTAVALCKNNKVDIDSIIKKYQIA
jgi:prophage antirepressor-like protein